MDEIQNCGWQFRVQCPLRWSQLAKTSDTKVRQCGVCLREVYWCDSVAEAAEHAAKGHCVALYTHPVEEDDGNCLLRDLVPLE